jgi:hypothetical protein
LISAIIQSTKIRITSLDAPGPHQTQEEARPQATFQLYVGRTQFRISAMLDTITEPYCSYYESEFARFAVRNLIAFPRVLACPVLALVTHLYQRLLYLRFNSTIFQMQHRRVNKYVTKEVSPGQQDIPWYNLQAAQLHMNGVPIIPSLSDTSTGGGAPDQGPFRISFPERPYSVH